MLAREAQGEAQWEPEPCASGSSRGLTPPGPWGRAVLGQPSRAYANQMGPGLGGFGRTWQDSLPREELDQDRLPEGVGVGIGPGQDEATSQQPMETGTPGYPGRINSTHVGQGRVDCLLLPSNRVGGGGGFYQRFEVFMTLFWFFFFNCLF